MTNINANFENIETTIPVKVECDSTELKVEVGSDSTELIVSVGSEIIISETTDYNKLINKPQINSVELIGNKTGEELNLQDKMTAITEQDIDNIIFGG